MARREVEREIADFLRGDSQLHESLRRGVRCVVRSFRFAGRAIEEDCVQETLARVLANVSAGAFRGESTLGTYAQRVARYVCLEQIRRRRFTQEVDPAGPPPAADDTPEAAAIRAEEHRRNLKILASIPPECRELFRLIFVEGLRYAEVAERLGISEMAVKLRVHRCRLTMRSSPEAGDAIQEPSPRWRHYES